VHDGYFRRFSSGTIATMAIITSSDAMP
jgi:hypothetical protein